MENVEPGVEDLEVTESFINNLKDTARINFEEDGTLTPVCFIGAQVNPMNGEPLVGPSLIIAVSPQQLGISMENSSGTQMFTDAVRMISRSSKAIMVVTVMEAWVLKLDNLDDRKSLPKSLEHVPGREECIQIMLEHQKLGTKTKMWSALITRDEQGRATLGDFKAMNLDKAEGRFMGFIDHPN